MTENENKLYKELQKEILEINDRNPTLSPDNAFLTWFIKAYISDDENKAIESLTGGSNDKGIDAIYIDHKTKIVFVIQGKYNHSINKKSEKSNDVTALANIGRSLLLEEDGLFKQITSTAENITRIKLEEARNIIQNRNYNLHLQFITTGKVSKSITEQAETMIEDWETANYDIFNGEDILLLCQQYIDGIAPPPPTIKLPIDNEQHIEKHDEKTGNTSWIFTMNGTDIGNIYNEIGRRLFARNIRGFLGNNEINKSIEKTLEKEPHLFWYYNNGITIIGNKVKLESSKGETYISLSNAQIINGQQTTRVLGKHRKNNAKVLIRIIEIPNKPEDTQLDKMVRQIVKATNYQNQITAADLKSNDIEQIRIEKELRKLSYLYLRKRSSSEEIAEININKYQWKVRKDRLAKIIGACILDPFIVREGKNKLFADEIYKKIFNQRPIKEYLVFHWMDKLIASLTQKDTRRYYAHWLILNFMWGNLEVYFKNNIIQKNFIYAAERHKQPKYKNIIKHLFQISEKGYVAAMKFYRINKEKNGKITDISSFFRQPNLEIEFNKFWSKQNSAKKKMFNKNIALFIKQIEKINLD